MRKFGRHIAIGLLGLALVGLTAACSSKEEKPAPKATATRAAATAAAPTATRAAATPTRAAATATAAAAAGGTEAVTLAEFTVTPSPAKAAPGATKFSVSNKGQAPHELVVVKTDLAPDKLPKAGAQVDEKGAGITVAGAVKDVAPGVTKDGTITLEKGKYVLICNLPGHYDLGMRTAFSVE